uniref:Uncharacterized protein n=1 Tax=Cucumis melo TaxID=3656 RepID=A0A9I9EDU2_CUCME
MRGFSNLHLRNLVRRDCQSSMDIDMIRVIRRDPRSPIVLLFHPGSLQTTLSKSLILKCDKDEYEFMLGRSELVKMKNDLNPLNSISFLFLFPSLNEFHNPILNLEISGVLIKHKKNDVISFTLHLGPSEEVLRNGVGGSIMALSHAINELVLRLGLVRSSTQLSQFTPIQGSRLHYGSKRAKLISSIDI